MKLTKEALFSLGLKFTKLNTLADGSYEAKEGEHEQA